MHTNITTIRNIAHKLAVLERRLRTNVALGKHAAYIKAEFVEIEDALLKQCNILHRCADALGTAEK